jgi:hypothetical protein
MATRRQSLAESPQVPLEKLDEGIRPVVELLVKNGVETFESCEGGEGHAFFEPTVRFHGSHAEGFRALSIALQHGLKVCELRRYYSVEDGEPVGPHWEMTFLLGTTFPRGSTEHSPGKVVSR